MTRMMPKSAVMVLFALLLLAHGASAATAKQLAIVVGNDAYKEVPPLSAGVNDAMAMAEGLKRTGFAVELVVNGTKRQISRALATVESNITPGDTVVFHFSGHGFEIDGQNWLLPIDVPAAREGEAGLVKDESFNAADVVDRLRARGAGTVIAILDACRNNPFARPGTRALGGTRGLARMDPSGGVFIMFSAGSKQEALDKLSPTDATPTSIFVRSFLPLLGRSDLSLIDMAKETQEKVRELARSIGHEQVPAYYDGIVGRVTLTGVPVTRLDPPRQQDSASSQQPRSAAAEDTFWQSIQDSNQPALYDAYLAQVRSKVFTGTYAQIAELKLAALRAASPDVSSAPPAAAEPKPSVHPAPQVALLGSSDTRRPPTDGVRSAEVVACDAAAADRGDRDRPVDVHGVELTRTTAALAIAACAKAIATASAPRRMFYQLGRAHEANGESTSGIDDLQKAADLGHALASFTLAEKYAAGQNVPKNSAKAMALYYKAADAGIYAAIVKIGSMHARGEGADRDYVKAMAFYNLALKVREPSVYADLGLLFLHGRGVARDKRKACDLFAEGASLGNAAAAQNAASFCKS